MKIPAPLATQLRVALRNFGAAHSAAAVPNSEGRALEVLTMMSLADAAVKSGKWGARLMRGNGRILWSGRSFYLPKKSSGVPKHSAKAPGYIEISSHSNPAETYELRANLQWTGRSGAKHECDISLLPGNIGQALRLNGGGSPRGVPVVAIECKAKSGTGTLDEMRETLARMFDLALVTSPPSTTPCRIFEARKYNTWGGHTSKYLALFSKGLLGVARATKFQSGAIKLGDHYHIEQYPEIYVSGSTSMGDLTKDFVTVLNQANTY